MTGRALAPGLPLPLKRAPGIPQRHAMRSGKRPRRIVTELQRQVHPFHGGQGLQALALLAAEIVGHTFHPASIGQPCRTGTRSAGVPVALTGRTGAWEAGSSDPA